MDFGKNIDTKKMHKEFIKHEHFLLKKQNNEIKGEKDEKIFILPFTEINNTKGISDWKALVQNDILQRRYKSFGCTTSVMPCITISYITALQEIHKNKHTNHTELRKKLHQAYKKTLKKRESLNIVVSTDTAYTLSEHDFLSYLQDNTKKLFKEGYIYNNYDVRYRSIQSQTAISEQEVEHEVIEGNTYLIKFFVDTKKHTITINIDNPTHIFGTVAIAVHPLDKRYKKFIGKKVIVPIINKTIPVIGDESIDMTQHQGAVALIPGHNKAHLDIAKRHEYITTDIFAVDEYGIFTNEAGQFAGKPADEFYENIVRFLTDISNLHQIIPCQQSIPYHKKTGERLVTQASYQRFFALPENHIYPDTEVQLFPPQAELRRENLHTQHQRCISKQLPGIPKFPFCQTTEGRVQELFVPKLSETKKKTFLTHCLIEAIKDGLLDTPFTTKDAIEALGYYDTKNKSNFWKLYAQKYQKDTTSNAYKALETIFENIEANPQDEKAYHEFMSFLEQHIGIDHITEDRYDIKRTELFELPKLQAPSHCYDNTWLAVQTTEYLMQKAQKDAQILLTTTTETENKIKLWYQYQATKAQTQDIQIIKTENTTEHQDLPTHYKKEYLADSIRLWMIWGDTNVHIDHFEELCKKIRNASRLIRKTHTKACKNTDTACFLETVTDASKLSEIDTWIITETFQLIEDSKYHMNKNESFVQGEKIIDHIQYNLADLYLEELKNDHNGENTVILVYMLQLTLQLLYPYAPSLCYTIAQLCNFPLAVETIASHSEPTHIKKNYRFSLMMSIIAQRRKQIQVLKKEQKEGRVQLYIQSNRDFLSFVEQYEEFIKSHISDATIIYKNEAESLPDTSRQTTIVNITIGIEYKKQEIIKDDTTKLELEKKLQENTQMIQKYRSILQSIPPSDITNRKKYEDELAGLKDTATQIEYEIQKRKYQRK